MINEIMQTINGIGTTLYGKRYLDKKELRNMDIDVPEGVQPYIATMWFVFLFIPLIPLGSYIVFFEGKVEEGFWSSDDKYYHMIKINLNWNQVLKTWLIPVFIIFLLWLLGR